MRLKTGVPGLDNLIEGGFPAGSAILLTGAEGTGKTLMALQIAGKKSLEGHKVLYLTFTQSPEEILAEGKRFGWNLSKVNISHIELAVKDPLEEINAQINKAKPDLIIIDSLSDLIGFAARIKRESGILAAEWPEDFRRLLVHLVVERLKKSGATSICISEYHTGQPGLSWDGVSEFVCDGVIALEAEVVGETLQRSMRVVKMRQTKIDGGRRVLEITPKGLKISQ